jgi:CheY-like chemotaxis protein/HPt (histidine-containing phosphotransfer) domain-containing protein
MNTPLDPANNAADMNAALAMGGLLAEMNHDIRTSMNGIVGMLDLLLETDLSSSQQQYARIAQHSADTLLQVIERISDLSLIESSRFKLSQARFDLLEEIKAACSQKRAAVEAKGLQLTVNYPPALSLNGDPSRLRQVITGLISNAIRAAERGAVTVNVETSAEANGRWRLRASAHIAGLSDESARLALLLNQPAKSGIDAFAAHGPWAMEAALCARVARLMGGRIGVDCVPQHGTTFWFTVELASTTLPLPNARMLLLTEDIAAWQGLIDQINAQGVRADAFNSVSKALEVMANAATEHSPYHVIMLAPKVQGMDAEMLGAAIKADPAYKNALLGILSEPNEDGQTYQQAGFSIFADPATPSQALLSTMAELLSGERKEAAAAPSAMAMISPNEISEPLADRRILVADDNPVNLQVATRMLEKLGCSVSTATNGEEAVEMHAAGIYDLVLMDCEMPHMNGYQATGRIRSLDGNVRHTPIVALTALAAQGEREKCLAAGMDDYLSKPVRPQTLKDTLSRWLPRTAPPSSTPPVMPSYEDELEAMQEMFGADFPDLVALYLTDAPPRLAALHEAWKTEDHIQVGRIAHAFAGSSASIGATGLSALCKELEISEKAGTLVDFAEKIAIIEAEYRRISSKLSALIGN